MMMPRTSCPFLLRQYAELKTKHAIDTKKQLTTRVSREVSNYLVSWFIAHLGDLQPTSIGVIIHLLSTMDIPVHTQKLPWSLLGDKAILIIPKTSKHLRRYSDPKKPNVRT